MPIDNRVIKIAFALAATLLGAPVFAEEQSPATMNMPTATTEMSPALHKDMANMYRKMADCLDAGSSAHDCMQTVMENCPVIAKTGRCPIAEGMGSMMLSHPGK
jgi:uncharacterized protein YgiB involved in biofilm formation